MTQALRQFDLYQGRDWTSFRLSVAQVFETLDQMQDYCPPLAAPEAEDMLECLSAVRELADGLSGEVDMMLADILPQMNQGAVAGAAGTAARWSAVEVRHHLDQLRRLLAEIARPGTAFARQESGLFQATEAVSKIKDLVRKIDSI